MIEQAAWILHCYNLHRFKEVLRMSIFREFKEYIMKGNALDLAIGVVLGAALVLL